MKLERLGQEFSIIYPNVECGYFEEIGKHDRVQQWGHLFLEHSVAIPDRYITEPSRCFVRGNDGLFRPRTGLKHILGVINPGAGNVYEFRELTRESISLATN